jgi:hypothetical protein
MWKGARCQTKRSRKADGKNGIYGETKKNISVKNQWKKKEKKIEGWEEVCRG